MFLIPIQKHCLTWTPSWPLRPFFDNFFSQKKTKPFFWAPVTHMVESDFHISRSESEFCSQLTNHFSWVIINHWTFYIVLKYLCGSWRVFALRGKSRTHRLTYRQTDRQKDRQIDRQITLSINRRIQKFLFGQWSDEVTWLVVITWSSEDELNKWLRQYMWIA